MVSARLVECPESPEFVCTKLIPEMMFAAGEEPVGVRVLTYQSSGAIKRILNTLEAEEVEIIRRSAFGKIIDIADKPVFSGRFARYMLSRQLKTKKKHEVWFRFAGKPLVMVEAVPSLTEVVQESCSSSESDSEDDVLDPRWAKKQTLSPAHARNVDKKSHVVVRSILSQDSDRPVDEASVLWSDEEEDETVDNMVELINSNYTFVHSMFVGGVTKMEVDHMRENSKPAMKTKESKQHSSSTVDIDPGFVGSLVIEHIKPHVAVMELKLNQTSRRIDSIESYLTGYLESLMGKFKEEMLQTITSMGVVKESVNGSPLPDLNFADNIEDPQTSRKSKRQKMVPSDLVENYHCGPHILSRLRRSQKFVFICVINVAGLSVSSKEIILIAERSRIFPPKVVDILIHLVRSVVLQHLSNENLHSCYFLDTKFGSALVRSYPKFKKLKNKESYSFPKGVLSLVNDDGGTPLQARGYYFPFSLGKEHWVGVYFDTVQGHFSVLDCNMSYSNEASVAKFLTPLLHMLPYLSTRGSMDIVREEVMPFRFDRPKVVSQIDHLPDSGLMAVLLMVTHAVYGIDACKNISTTSLSEEGKSAAIMAYEFKEKL
uniref:Ubiquitin-like protease family profile domain-containing protein n=1 Tax=Brassica oleracea var. oleracea TaxID=109376 RepID=A0A0D3CR25_BRAOL